MLNRVLHRLPAVTLSPGSSPEEDGGGAAIPLDTIRAIADFTSRAYAEETARTKDLDGKATPLIGATGTVILFAATSLTKSQSSWTLGQSRTYFVAVGVCILILLAALICFLRAIALRSHPRPVVTSWLEAEDVKQEPTMLLWQMARTYADAVAQHESVTIGKLAWFRRGLHLLLIGFVGLVFVFAAMSVIDNHLWP